MYIYIHIAVVFVPALGCFVFVKLNSFRIHVYSDRFKAHSRLFHAHSHRHRAHTHTLAAQQHISHTTVEVQGLFVARLLVEPFDSVPVFLARGASLESLAFLKLP